jgi:serine/threonine-protein kinase
MWNVRLARRQVRSFASFSHASVVPFVDVGTAGGLHYLVWPLVDGVTLEALVQENGKLASNVAAFYVRQVAEGMTDAHQNTLFHGLLKPSNIMIGENNQACILDFGIGSLLVENEGESLVDTMSTANTLTSGLDCASPESIMEPTNRTPAGDQYSLGCILYFCLTGRVPFPEGSAVEKMMAHQTKEPMPIKELASDVPDGLIAVVTKLMSKKPEERYSACDTVVEALEPFVGDLARIPGGVPNARKNHAIAGSSSRMAGLGGRPLSGHGSGSRPAIPSRGNVVNPTPHLNNRSVPQSGERKVPGRAPAPAPSGSRPGVGRTPPPIPGRSGTSNPKQAGLPSGTQNSRPSSAGNAAPPPPPRGSRVATRPAAPPPSRVAPPRAKDETDTDNVPLGWAEEDNEQPRRALSPLVLVGIALILMITVYIGATKLMNP